jgi:hypothetical protein
MSGIPFRCVHGDSALRDGGSASGLSRHLLYGSASWGTELTADLTDYRMT